MAMNFPSASGGFRGRHRWRWWAEIHSLDRGSADVTDLIVGWHTHKSLGEPAGTFRLTLKPTSAIDGIWFDALDRIDDDDWVSMGAIDETGRRWVVMLGMVDQVQRARSGQAGATTFTISGRDIGKALTRTDILDMPWLGVDLAKGFGSAAEATDAVNALPTKSPGHLLRRVATYCLAGDTYRGPRRLWGVPQTMEFPPVEGATVVDRDIRQLSDVLDLRHVRLDLRGIMPGQLAVPIGVGQGGGLWNWATQVANGVLNELHYDLIAHPGREGDPNAYIMAGNGAVAAPVSPSLRLRERPFPTLQSTPAGPDGVSGSDRWRSLPVTELDERDLESYTMAHAGAERFDWFLLEGGGMDLTARGLAAQIAGQSGDVAAWDAIPSVLLGEAERHGLQRMQQASSFFDPNAARPEDFELAVAWTRLIRDWYAPNGRFLSGTAKLPHLAPGIRIGERLRVVNVRAGRQTFIEEAYVEGVEHSGTMRPDGSAETGTTVMLTRGWRLDPGGPDYAGAVEAWLAATFEASE